MIQYKLFLLPFFFVFLFLGNVFALSVTINVPEKYTDVSPGERFYFEVGVKYPENPQRKDLRLEYEITDEGGNLVAQSKVLKAVETQASFIDFIVIPETARKGLYFVNVKILDYEELSEEVSSSFYVSGKITNLQIYFILILVSIFIVGVFIAINIRGTKKRK